MRKIYFALLMLLILFGFTNCTHLFYAPNSLNVPGFKKQGEVRLTSSYSTGEYLEAIEGQIAVSATSQIGIMGNYIYGHSNPTAENDYGKGYIAELGAGYFKEVAENEVFEFYSGVGVGKVTNVFDDNSSSVINFHRYFLQPSFSIRSKHMEICFASRFAILNWRDVEIDSVGFAIGSFRSYSDQLKPGSYMLIEPAITWRVGLKNVKLQAQLIGSYSNPLFNHEEIMLNFGIVVMLDGLFGEKNNERKSL